MAIPKPIVFSGLLAYDDALKSAKKLDNHAHVTLGKVLFLSNAQQGTIDQNEGVVFAEQQDMNTY